MIILDGLVLSKNGLSSLLLHYDKKKIMWEWERYSNIFDICISILLILGAHTVYNMVVKHS